MTTALLIDDMPENNALLEAYLSMFQLEVITALTGKEGYIMAQNSLPDIIFLDLLMPEYTWDGYYTIQQLKTNPSTEGIPVVVVTAAGDEEKAYNTGCDGFIKRPFQIDDVRAILDKFLSDGM